MTRDDASDTSDWYLADAFWRDFGDLMFNAESFAEAAEQAPELLALAGNDPKCILDLGCGPGRHALAFARSGRSVTAIDTSPTLLAQLEDHIRSEPVEPAIETLEADMRSFVRDQAFDLVTVLWTSFGYFEDESDHARVLDNIHASLADGGRVLIDVVGLEYLCRHLQPVHLTEHDDGRLLVERPLLTDDLTRLENEWLLIEGERVRRHEFSHRVWSAGELRALLARCRFETVGVYGDYAGGDYDLDSERLIIVAERVDI